MTTDSAQLPELSYGAEVRRKLLHLFALTIPIGYHLVSRPTAVGVVFVAFAVALLVDFGRLRSWPIQRGWQHYTDPIVRPREALAFTGAVHILFSGWLCPLFLAVPAAATGMVTIIFGDTAAALVGRRWGRHRYTGNRSLEGSLAFFLAALIGAWLVPGVSFLLGTAAALLAAVVEGLSRTVDDNLTVPVIVGLFVHLALRIG